MVEVGMNCVGFGRLLVARFNCQPATMHGYNQIMSATDANVPDPETDSVVSDVPVLPKHSQKRSSKTPSKRTKTSATTETRRPSLPQNIETDVLVRSRRRCCLCAFLNNDFSVKQFQVAHIDHNPANNQLDNLVSLCLEHHDDYDTRRSQSKGITANEIKYWRGELDKVWQKRDEQLSIQVGGSGGLESQRLVKPSARLLGEVLNALDDDMLRWQEGGTWTGRPTGIKLTRLGQRAIMEEGDLDVALEAFMSLLRLSVAAPALSSGGMRQHQTMPMLTPPLSAVELLHTMRQDHGLVFEAARNAQIYALIGDEPHSDLADYSNVPHKSWKTVVDIIYHDTKFNQPDREEGLRGGYLVSCLPELLVGLGVVLLDRDVNLPDAPHEIRITTSDERGVEPGQPKEIEPYVYLANKIAMLPEGDFQFALERLKYYRHPVSQVIVDPENYRRYNLEDALEEIRAWTIRPGFENTFVAVDNEESKTQCSNLIHTLQKLGQTSANSARAFLIAERDCAINQRYFREGTTAPNALSVDMESDQVIFGF